MIEVCNYLPYGLQMVNTKSGRIITVSGVHVDSTVTIFDAVEGNYYDLGIWPFKMLLYPLEDFVKFESVLNEMTDWNVENLKEKIAFGVPSTDGFTGSLNYPTVKEMIKNHIDVHNLIPKELALNKNDYEDRRTNTEVSKNL